MALQTPLLEGDWVRATSKRGSIIEGQAQHSVGTAGFAHLYILIADEWDTQEIRINVNIWDVEVIKPNNLIWKEKLDRQR